MNAKHAYEMLMQDMRASIDHNTQGKESKSVMKGKKLAAAAQGSPRVGTPATARAPPPNEICPNPRLISPRRAASRDVGSCERPRRDRLVVTASS